MAVGPASHGGLRHHDHNLARIGARILMTAWAAALLAGAILTPAIEQSSFGNTWYDPRILLEAVLVAIPAVGVAVAWRQGRIGSIVLIAEGIVLCLGYPIVVAIGERYGAFYDSTGTPLGPVQVLLFAALSGIPPVIAGLLLWHDSLRDAAA